MSSKKTYTFKPLGLNTNSNPIALPRGALTKALDVSLDRPGIIESRADWSALNSYSPVGNATGYDRTLGIPFVSQNYACSIVSQVTGGHWDGFTGSTGGISSSRGSSNLQVTAASGAVSTLVGGPITSFFRSGQNDYILSQPNQRPGTSPSPSKLGAVYRNDFSKIRDGGAGMPEALTPLVYTNTAGTISGITFSSFPTPLSNQLNSTLQCAYRVLLASKDQSGTLVRGVPSGRLIVYGPTLAYGLVILLTKGLTFAGDIVQVYRSEIVSTGPTEPSDECRQVFEYILTQSDVNNGYFAFPNDITPESIRGPSLYTNDSQQGISQAEAPPPNCSFGEFFKGTAFYSGVISKGQSQLFSVLGTQNWSAGTTFTVVNTASSTTYVMTADTAEDLPNRKFLLDTTSPTPALQLFNTTRSLCRAISYNNPDVLASYITGSNDISAQFVLKSVRVSNESSITAYFGNLFQASVVSPITYLTRQLALTRSNKGSFLYYSKPGQPEAVPDLNYVEVGNPGFPIVGMRSCRDSLFVFKPEGLFRVTGTTSATIRVELFDPTVRMNPGQYRSIDAGGNSLFAVCTLGVVRIHESGCEVVSIPIDNIVSQYKTSYNDGGGSIIAPYALNGVCVESTQSYFLLLTDTDNAVTTTQRLMVYNYRENLWSEWTAPFSFCTGVGVTTNGSSEIVQANGDSVFGVKTIQTGTAPTAYAPSPTFTYCMDSGEAPDVLQRFEWVKLITLDSSGLGAFTFTFSSDSGATQESLTVANGAAPGVVRCDIPRSHAVCGQLTIQVTCAGGRAVVYGMIIGYDDVSDWMNSRNNT